jgi:hypothetical protein
MIREILVCLLATFFLGTVSSAAAQHEKKIPRIGFFSTRSGPGVFLAAFKERLAVRGESLIGWVATGSRELI